MLFRKRHPNKKSSSLYQIAGEKITFPITLQTDGRKYKVDYIIRIVQQKHQKIFSGRSTKCLTRIFLPFLLKPKIKNGGIRFTTKPLPLKLKCPQRTLGAQPLVKNSNDFWKLIYYNYLQDLITYLLLSIIQSSVYIIHIIVLCTLFFKSIV